MIKFKKQKRSIKAGLEPGTIVYIGKRTSNSPVKLRLIEYNEEFFEESQLENISFCDHQDDLHTVKWLNVDGVHDSKLIQEIGDKFKLHPLLLEEISNTEQRPKVDEYEGVLFIIVKMLTYDEKEKRTEVEQVSLVLGKNFLISFQEDKEGDVFNPLRDRLRAGKQKIKKGGADYLLFSILDIMIDHYFIILEKIDDEVDILETILISRQSYQVIRNIYRLKREIIFLRKSILPMREVLSTLERTDNDLIKEPTQLYFRDIYDHAIQVIENIEMYRDMLTGMQDISMTTASNRMNNIMKVLTVISTIFIPLTFIVGVYGMNFDYMPELRWKYGYLMIWIIMLSVVGTMVYWFKKKGWF